MSRPILKLPDIHRAALKLFVDKGIEGTTTREIAALAQAGEGTMFRHYKSKEALAWHLFDENLRRFLHELEADIQQQATAQQQLRAMIEKCYYLFETDKTMCSYLLLSEHSVARHMPADYKTPITILVQLLAEGQTHNTVRAMDPQVAAALVFGAVLRVPLFKLYGRIHRDLREMIDEVTEAVWQMVSV